MGARYVFGGVPSQGTRMGVPLTYVYYHGIYCVFLGFLGITHKYPLYRAYIGVSHKGYVGRGTSNYPLTLSETSILSILLMVHKPVKVGSLSHHLHSFFFKHSRWFQHLKIGGWISGFLWLCSFPRRAIISLN